MTGFGRRPFLAILASAFLPETAFALAEKPPRHRVKVDEPVWIEVSAGIRLAGRLWLPETPAGERFPVVLEYIPYRTFDRYRPLDDYWGAALAARGIAFARVDIRGSGNSEGLLLDEYLASEQQDGADVIAWLARQPWCNGAVGMRGLSWGGFSTLQIAAQRPPALKAIMPMCATDMRFRNDAHYVGGLPGLTNLKWAAGFELVMSSPPDPAVVGPDWEKMWRARLAATPSIAARWLSHDSNDDYWRHGSVGLTPDVIACPTYLVDGWADSYGQSAERLLRDLKAPHKALFGPWGHIYPQFAQPGPGLDWIEEEESWWKRWLNDRPAGAVDGPAFRFYIAYATPAQSGMKSVAGRWAAEQHWPSPNIRERLLHLAPKRLAGAPAAGRLSYRAEKVVGLTAPEWIPYAATELPRDQAPDDARSLTFDLAIADTRGGCGAAVRGRCDGEIVAGELWHPQPLFPRRRHRRPPAYRAGQILRRRYRSRADRLSLQTRLHVAAGAVGQPVAVGLAVARTGDPAIRSGGMPARAPGAEPPRGRSRFPHSGERPAIPARQSEPRHQGAARRQGSYRRRVAGLVEQGRGDRHLIVGRRAGYDARL